VNRCIPRFAQTNERPSRPPARHGLDHCILAPTCEYPRTAARLKASPKEGLGNGVTAAPAAFLNGHRAQGRPDLETVIELVEEEHERLAQAPVRKSCLPGHWHPWWGGALAVR
jgi:hypothetical protein